MKFNMNRVSTNLDGLSKSHFDVIVVGSGYGGGVSAARLSAAGQSVLMLERGREILPGEYPNTPQEAAKETQVTTALNGRITPDSNGLLDLHVNDDMSVIVGCGLGGTSLLNANVALEPQSEVLQSTRWPKALRKTDALKEYYQKARDMLGSNPLPARYHPNKLKALEVSAEGMGLKVERPPINVTFEEGLSAGGVMQAACNLCGDCCSGCNYGAKNTTLMNYIPYAHGHGAQIVTEAGVLKIAEVNEGWLVTVEDRRPGSNSVTRKVTANTLILAAGSLGTTEILLRSRSEKLTFSDKLGTGFSGNGDVLGFGYDAFWNNEVNSGDDPQLPIYGVGAGTNRPDLPQYQPGPCITGVIKVIPKDDEPYTKGMVIEEGVAPGAVSIGFPMGMFMQQALHADFKRFPDIEKRLREAQAVGEIVTGGLTSSSDENGSEAKPSIADMPYVGAASQTQTFLVMSHDDANGELALNKDTDCVVVNWPGVGEQDNYIEVNDRLREASDMIWANYIPNPLWREAFGRRVVTVHPVGGCCMGNDAKDGVVNDECQVFSGDGKDVHKGLYVCDGSVIPSSLGTNPLLTISAVSERAMDLLITREKWSGTQVMTKEALCAPLTKNEPVRKEDNTLEKIDGILEMLEGWHRDILAEKYEEVRKTITDHITNLLPSGGDSKTMARLQKLLMHMGLTKGELASDIAPSIQFVVDILKPVRDHIEKGEYPQAAEYLIQSCGDYSPNLAFNEEMSGHISRPEIPPTTALSDPYEISAKYGEMAGRSMVAKFRVVADSLQELAESDQHEANLFGEIECPFLSPEPMQVMEGAKFNLLIQNEGKIETWNMIYTARLDANGRELLFRGVKTLTRRTGSHWWSDLTTLSVDIFADEDTSKDPIACGVIRLGVQELIKQLSSMTSELPAEQDSDIFKTLALDAILWGDLENDLKNPKLREKLLRKLIGMLAAASDSGFAQKIQLFFMAKLGKYFGMLVFRTYGELLAYLYNFPTRALLEGKVEPLPPLSGAALRHKGNVASESHPLKVKTGEDQEHELHLTRYNAGTKGPVILAPGFATRAASFAINTVDWNLVDCLCAEDYDVWLFDYRSSPLLDASLEPFTIDDVVTQDWPAAISYIQEIAGVKDMHAIVHCMGSMTCLMAMLNGLEGIRSVVSSQLTLHPVTNWFNKFKADTFISRMIRDGLPENLLPVADALAPNKAVADLFRGLDTIDANSTVIENPDKKDRFLQDQVTNLLTWEVPFPNDAPCYSPTCHRIFGIYGPVFAHEQLNEATHNAIQTVFGRLSTKPFQQLAEIVRQGIAVNANGENVYLDNKDKSLPGNHERLQKPITFLAGALNQEFMPDTSLRTYFWLLDTNPEFEHYYKRIVFEDYAHMDFFLGKNAHLDIYPTILEALERHDRLLNPNL